jgi:lipopolysaccharide/colanic/teichoic acid biosynthesis glycosyltransferase
MRASQDVKLTEMRKHADPSRLLVVDVRSESPVRSQWHQRAKCVLDFGCALMLLILTAPIVVLAAIAVKLTSRGPVFYCQTRTGLGGRPYTIYKIRTMAHNCESESGVRWASSGDPRITLVGRWLRRTHIDELPQLWNILRGEMSLVGPRPERPEFVIRLEQVFPDYQRRLAVRPGLSGLAQIQLPPDTDLESVRRKLVYDLYYVDRRTLWLDIRIILSTICKVLSIPFVVPRTVLQLPSGELVEGAGQVAANDSGERPTFVPASFSSVS